MVNINITTYVNFPETREKMKRWRDKLVRGKLVRKLSMWLLFRGLIIQPLIS